MSTIFLVLGILFVLSLIPAGWLALHAYLKYRGARVITCPEESCPAAVEVDVCRTAAAAAFGEHVVRLKSCSRWPERQACGQECLAQIEAAPAECLVRTMLVDWYRGSSCVLCGKEIGEIHWVEHKPALFTPERKTVEWDEVPAEKLPQVLATHQRVCWNCHIATTFRERFPGLVTERPARRAP
ncbi:MAG: hypothetical protein WEB59_00720 [Thermoanaerobaculia bacterium]